MKHLRLLTEFLLVVLLVAFFVGYCAPSAKAAPNIDVPGIEICKPKPPPAASPAEGLVGIISEKPRQVIDTSDPQKIWSTGGLAGLSVEPYDLGCALTVQSAINTVEANTSARFSNGLIAAGVAATGFTDALDRRAWSPTWIVGFLGDFAERAVGILQVEIVLPLLVVGLFATSGFLLYRWHGGDMSSASTGVAWSLFVVLIVAFIVANPVLIPQTVQRAGGGTVAALNQGSNPSDAVTDKIAYSIHYQGFLRRTFGTEQSAVGQQVGPALLASRRITWNEWQSVKDNPDALERLRERKAAQFARAAEAVKEADPAAYRYLTGQQSNFGAAWIEFLSAIIASAFRIMVDILLLLATVMLALLGLFWLATAPWTVTPPGQEMGIGILNSAKSAVISVFIAAVGSWLFVVYLQVALAPGMSSWWSIFLVLLGTVVFWTAIRPDRKALSLLTGGRVNGYGKLTRALTRLAMVYVGGKVAGNVVANEMPPQQPQWVRSEDLSSPPPPMPAYVPPPVPRVYEGTVETPAGSAAGLPSTVTIVDGEIIEPRPALHNGVPLYQRGSEPSMPAVAPPAGSVGEVVVYQRRDTDADERIDA